MTSIYMVYGIQGLPGVQCIKNRLMLINIIDAKVGSNRGKLSSNYDVKMISMKRNED